MQEFVPGCLWLLIVYTFTICFHKCNTHVKKDSIIISILEDNYKWKSVSYFIFNKTLALLKHKTTQGRLTQMNTPYVGTVILQYSIRFPLAPTVQLHNTVCKPSIEQLLQQSVCSVSGNLYLRMHCGVVYCVYPVWTTLTYRLTRSVRVIHGMAAAVNSTLRVSNSIVRVNNS